MVSDVKKKFVQELIVSIKEYPLVGIVNLQNLPAQQLQKMRALLLKNDVKIIMARKKLLELALSESGQKNIEQLKEKIKGMPALLFSKSNPFTLYKTIQKNKSEAPAKAGQVAPKDVVVKAGPTNFAPGPIISELAAVGIKTKVVDGKLAIIEDAIVVKDGEEISAKVAETLKRLDIKPMEVGLDLVAVWENGLVFEAKQLHIDEAEYLGKITQAAKWAMNLAVEAAITTPETTEVLLQKAFRDAKALAIEQHILNDETKEEILGKVESQANAVKEAANVEVGSAPVEEKKEEEPKVEEKTEEPTPTPVEEPKAEEKPVEEVKPEPVVEESKVEEKTEGPTPESVEEPKAEEVPIVEEEEKPAEPEPTENEVSGGSENSENSPEPVVEETPAEESQSQEEPKDEEPVSEEAPVEEEKKEEEVAPEPVEEPKEDSAPVEETPTEEPKEEVAPEAKEEPEPTPEPQPAPEPEPEPTPQPDPEPEKPMPEPTPEPSKPPVTNQESQNDIPTAEDLIKQTMDKFDKTNNPVAGEEKKVEAVQEDVSAESLVNAELEVAAEEQKEKEASEVKKDKSVEEAENLFEKLKKTGTLREEN